MADVNGVNNQTNIYSQINKSDEAEKAKDGTSDMFMKLMLANLRNQDPTNPADTSEYMQQISDMTMVEGIDNLNTTLEGMNSSLLASQSALQASSLVGQNVFVQTDNAVADSATGQIRGVLELGNSASEVSITVRDANGALVDQFSMGGQEAGDVDFGWQLEEGMPLGGYQFEATANVGGEAVAVPVFIGMNVNSVTLGQNGVGMKINIDGGSVSLDQVKQVG